MNQRTCLVEGCERPVKVKSRGWCSSHYQKWQTYGDPLYVHPTRTPLVGRKFVRLTVISFDRERGEWLCECECGRIAYARATHLKQGLKRSCGTPGPCHWRAAGDVSYSTVHARLRRSRGSASHHECVDCGGTAQQWSYNRSDPGELTETLRGLEVPYSARLEHYEPRCRKCHWRFDRPDATPKAG